MTNETLANMITEFTNLPAATVTAITDSISHHCLDCLSPYRDLDYFSQGELFIKCLDDEPACGAFFWLNGETGDWDLHLYTLGQFRRKGLATELFGQGLVPWLCDNGYLGTQIVTTLLDEEAADLASRLGFKKSDTSYKYSVEKWPATD